MEDPDVHGGVPLVVDLETRPNCTARRLDPDRQRPGESLRHQRQHGGHRRDGAPPGAYTLGETGGPEGYRPTGWECEDAPVTNDQVTLAAGDAITCTLTNKERSTPPPPTPTPTDDYGYGHGDDGYGNSGHRQDQSGRPSAHSGPTNRPVCGNRRGEDTGSSRRPRPGAGVGCRVERPVAGLRSLRA
ncbi:hypothetical protein ABZV52_30420 [Streptomyces sp. NPDC004735]|uniref:hypothetical protein n=1 Tax=Streptomyces sp. NPDC004735 TaxID=3156654 RepID=UPI0033B6C866